MQSSFFLSAASWIASLALAMTGVVIRIPLKLVKQWNRRGPVMARREELRRPRNFSSSFLLTRYLPLYSSACLPRFWMQRRKPQRFLACIARATPINPPAT